MDRRGGGGRGGGGGECGGAGQWNSPEICSEGWQVSSLLLKEMLMAVYGFKKASLINDAFISEIKSRQLWRQRIERWASVLPEEAAW